MTDEEKLVRENLPLVHWILHHRIGVSADRYSDAFQDGCLGLLKAIRAYDPAKGIPFAGFAAVCIKNAVLTNLRKPQNFTYDPDAVDVLDESADPARLFEIKQAMGEIRKSDPQGLLDLLAQGYTQGEIAKKLGVNQSTVSRKIRRIRRKIYGRCQKTLLR